MKRFISIFFECLILLSFTISCENTKVQITPNLFSQKTNSYKNEFRNKKLYKLNKLNLNMGNPFFILREKTPIYGEIPNKTIILPSKGNILSFGDIVFPVKGRNNRENSAFFFVRTIDNKYGWVYYKNGISLDCTGDSDLYYFGNKYYLKQYISAKGKTNNSSKVILLKNVIPLLLGRLKTDGWFYSTDYQLALKLAKYGVSIAGNKKTFFHSADSLYDWKVNEVVISNNLLADCYRKLKFYDKAIGIHNKIIKNYFWKRSDNTPIGGLNSVVQLESIYIEMLRAKGFGSADYEKLKQKIITLVLFVGEKLNVTTIIDKRWNLTGAEWTLAILQNSLPSKQFYDIINEIIKTTKSDGFKDMATLYVALKKYEEGYTDESLKMLALLKPRHHFRRSLKIKDWLKVKKLIPDSILYRYDLK